ncbi:MULTISPECIES: hypothetical protein [unclassified Pseudomonas]|uniref:hypothetical protein n=1 Tax=unclassified Pseudomonas TaxID=196821 RepID=UPI000A1E19AB|nr:MULTISPECIES: hypothetical protein [unclassified Pseudomonas]
MSPSSASQVAYHTYPVLLDNAAWMRAVYLKNPLRVAEMSQRLASVVQAAWQELKLHQHTSPISFGVYVKRSSGRTRDWIPLSLQVNFPAGESPYISIELQQV